MGSDGIGKQELDPKVLEKADLVIADSILQCVKCGETSHAINDGLINEKDVVEIG